jgi:hypothetical protein
MFKFRRFIFLLTLVTAASTIGLPTEKALAQDFDGDGVRDSASWDQRTGIWRIRTARGTLTIKWGTRGDIPVPADYDGNGTTDVAVWRPSNGNWYISTQNLSWDNRRGTERIIQWGSAGDKPIPGNYNSSRGGDEIAVYRQSDRTCFISTQNLSWNSRGESFATNQFENCGK